MKYNFDTVYDRTNTNSVKYDFAAEFGKPEGLCPLWVADMDFKIAVEIEEAVIKCARHGIFGYSDVKNSYYDALSSWFFERFGYKTQSDWLVKTPGVVFALAAAIRAFTLEGDCVLIQKPVYHPFSSIITDNNRKLINNPLIYTNGAYTIDFEDFEQKIIKNNVKLFILCSPHNPVGRVWTRAELEKMGNICFKHNCIVVSDEIHCDFVYAPHKHHVFSALRPEFEDNAIICTSPSKTFNLAGLQAANTFIKNKTLREKFQKELAKTGYHQLSTMGLAACEAAYKHGADWLNQLKEYLSANINLVRDFSKRTGIKLIEPEGTYLLWLDFSSLGLDDKALQNLIEKKAKLWLSHGLIFGLEGKGFQRINIACPRSVLEAALNNLETAIKNI
ncbi:MAG: pyridoxal phosphate-dependent aminotransferase [Elusimicrobia bacterium]|nr:pyridoxal phosphate-dependent aminotransferase [Elusimicrobiota bacterium]